MRKYFIIKLLCLLFIFIVFQGVAVFEYPLIAATQYTVITNVEGNGTIKKSPQKSTFSYGETVRLTAVPGKGWLFDHWTGDANSKKASLSLKINSNKTATAVFKPREYTIHTIVTGEGTISKSPDQATYHYGDQIVLTAVPNPGWKFAGWQGGSFGKDNPATITVTGNKTIKATFIQMEYTLNIIKEGNGSVTKSPNRTTYHYGDRVTLTATPNSKWHFSNWEGDATGSTPTVNIIINGDTNVKAVFALDQYILTINKEGNGTVNKTPDQAVYQSGDQVTLKAVPDLGWQFLKWQGDVTGTKDTVSVTMNSAKTVKAVFAPIAYTLSVTNEGNGSIKVNPQQTTYYYGDQVTLQAIPDPGWQLVSWQGVAAASTETIIIYINGNTNVKAIFRPIDYTFTINQEGNGSVAKTPDKDTYRYGDQVTLKAVPDPGWKFVQWQGAVTGTEETIKVTIHDHMAVTAIFTRPEYTLTVERIGSGLVTWTPEKTKYLDGDEVTLTTVPGAGWYFNRWEGALSGISNSVTLIMDGDKTVRAIFSQLNYTLNLTQSGNGSVIKNPDNSFYTYGAQVTLTATPEPGWDFIGWEDGLTGKTNPATITMNGNQSVKAVFKEKSYTLTVDTDGNGSIQKNPDQAVYNYGQQVTLKAIPRTGWVFEHWVGTNETGNPVTITIRDHVTVKAVFTRIPYTVNVAVEGDGTTSQSPAPYYYGDQVTITATAAAGWVFDHWVGSGDNSNPLTITVDGSKDLTAVFTKVSYMVNVTVNGNGTISQNPGPYYYGDQVTITATAAAGWVFDRWVGSSDNSNSLTITVDGSKEITAVFVKSTYRVTVHTEGNGTTSQDPAPYNYGDQVKITAAPAPGWVFDHWAGVSETANPAMITVDGDMDITAVFTRIPYTVNVATEGNGTVNQSPGPYYYGDQVTITAVASAGWTFDHWDGLIDSSNQVTITVDSDRNITAVFTPNEYHLTTNLIGNGSIDRSLNQPIYRYNDTVTLTAAPGLGWVFSGWSGDATGHDNPLNITIRSDLSITAIYKLAPVTNLQLVPDFNSINLSWTNPAFDWMSVKILRKTGGYPLSADDPQASVIASGRFSAFADQNLANDTYYYAVYVYDNNNNLSDPIAGMVTLSGLTNKYSYTYKPGDGSPYSTLKTAQNYQNDTFTAWNGSSLLIGPGVSGHVSDLWLYYPSIIGSNVGQIPAGSFIDRAKLVLKVKSFKGDKNKIHRLKIYPITDPNKLGTPYFGSTDGVLTGLNYNYRDSRAGRSIVWATGATSIRDLFNGVTPTDIYEYEPAKYDQYGLTTIVLDVTKAVQSWANLNGEPNQGWYITIDGQWATGDQLELYGGKTGNHQDDKPYLSVTYSYGSGNTQLNPVISLNATAGNNQVTLNWMNPTSSYTGIKIIRKLGMVPIDPYDGDLVFDGFGNTCIDNGVINGNLYYYAAFTHDHLRNYSTKAMIKVIPGTPLAPILYNPQAGSGSVSLSWSYGPGATAYHLYRQGAGEEAKMLPATSANNYIDNNVLVKEYTYWVIAVNSNGEGQASNTQTITPSASLYIPDAPQNLNAVAASSTSVNLNWTEISTNVAYFMIERNLATDTTWAEVGRVDFNQTSFNDTGLLPGTGYNYRIAAVNSKGSSSYANFSLVTTLNTPVAPANLSWIVVSSAKVQLIWNDSPNETSYRIEVLNPDTNSLLKTPVYITQNSTYYILLGLTANTKYRFRVIAINNAGEAASLTEIITTLPLADPGV